MRRRAILTAVALGLSALGAAAVRYAPPLLVWNATASAPVGLWRRGADAALVEGDWAFVQPQAGIARWMAAQGYLPAGALLVKSVAATEGQTVCRQSTDILIDSRLVARARVNDSRGRALPTWSGCLTLRSGELFLLNARPDSLDGRYFGVTPAQNVLGRAKLVWRR